MPSDKVSDLLLHKDGAAHADAPPAPPPYQPVTSDHNPYEFITNPPPGPKKSLLPKGNSKTGRFIVMGLAGLALIFLVMIFISLLNSGSAALKADYASLAGQQKEIIRVSGLGVSKARRADVKNLAINTQLTITSQQKDILALADKAGANTEPKELALSKNPKTDELLDTADKANQFDEAFTKTLHEALRKYQQTLQKVHTASSNETTKKILSDDYNAVNSLLGTTETETEAKPATQ